MWKLQQGANRKIWDFFQLQMVIIKYNNMKSQTKTLPQVIIKPARTLRSQTKHSSLQQPATGCQSQQKVIQQIKKQFENQQTITASKNVDAVHDDLKPMQEVMSSNRIMTRRGAKTLLSEPKVMPSVEVQSKKIETQPLPQPIIPQVKEIIPTEAVVQQEKQEQFNTPVKAHSREELNVYQSERKSYRKTHRIRRTHSVQVPYRRFQDQFQQKIVTLINKICQQKFNQKDIQLFLEKVQKVSVKQMFNPYVVSGVQTVLNLLQRLNSDQVAMIQKVSKEVAGLRLKIWTELGKMDEYENLSSEEKYVDTEVIRPRMMKKLYKMLLKTHKYGIQEAMQKSFEACEVFFENRNNQANENEIVDFFREQGFLDC